MAGAEHLDDIDLRILRHLQQDGRRPFREIAEEVGVSERTVRLRVAQMRAKGILQIVGIVNPAAIGFPIMAIVELAVDECELMSCIQQLKDNPAVRLVALTTGDHQLRVEVVLRTHAELARLIREDFAALRGVRATRVTLELEVYKNHFSYPWD
jgi:Lrp/AsnC family transcriptional regulator for asnA, asnC and gidA